MKKISIDKKILLLFILFVAVYLIFKTFVQESSLQNRKKIKLNPNFSEKKIENTNVQTTLQNDIESHQFKSPFIDENINIVPAENKLEQKDGFGSNDIEQPYKDSNTDGIDGNDGAD